ncbi:putative galactinol--sucrose galactosyltransferase [Dioscorea sansibarensis]
MTISATPCIRDDALLVGGRPVLTAVPPNIIVKPTAFSSSASFAGAAGSEASSRHVFTLGVLHGYRLLCLYRFKIWWMIPRFGNSASDVPLETQLLLLEGTKESALDNEQMETSASEDTFYVLFLPVLDGDFRASLQGNDANELQFCIESGDPDVWTSEVSEAVLINSSDNPFELTRDSIRILAKTMLNGFLAFAAIPANLDWFGWCTWDAFYTQVNPKGIMEGLQSLSDGGTPARFLIIDDGWQETVNEFVIEGHPHIEGTQFAMRLVDIKENHKFKNDDFDSACHDLGQFIKTIKEKHGLRHVYMWHALAGYWGGVLVTSEEMMKYNPKLEHPVQSPGNIGNVRDIAIDGLEKYGVGLVDPAKIYEFYNDLHCYLLKKGADGVKVDVQNLIETLGLGHGGRVSLSGKYQQALEESVAKNFPDNNVICCMCHNSDSIYSFKKSAVARASEDFMPRDPTSQTIHIASVAFNSLLLGETVVPDWDMFHSDHPSAEFHGAARAIGGCSVYVSDKPAKHNFEILRKLVLPDGFVLRAKHAGRPTRDCLFKDPVMDGKSLLKIWNLNEFTGVVGIFNCQGAGNWPLRKPTTLASTEPISGHVSPSDVEFLEDLAGEGWNGDSAVFTFNSEHLSRIPKMGILEVSLHTLQCEIFTISPIKDYGGKFEFAPLGLIEMYNSGGAIQGIKSIISPALFTIQIKCRGPGRFGAYSTTKPMQCRIDWNEVEYTYEPECGLLTFDLAVPKESSSNQIEIIYSSNQSNIC